MTTNPHDQSPPTNEDQRSPAATDAAGAPTNPYRLLGITNQNVSPFGVLGVSPETNDRTAILHALRNQLARLERHPESHSPEAHRLRRELQKAADLLLEPKTRAELRESFYGESGSPHQSEPAAPQSTPQSVSDTFDRGRQPTSTTPGRGGTDVRREKSKRKQSRSTRAVHSSSTPSSPAYDLESPAIQPEVNPPSSVDPVAAGITLAIASAGGWNASARRRIAAVAMENNLPPEALAPRILETVQTSGRQSIESWQHPGTTTQRPALVPTISPMAPPASQRPDEDRQGNGALPASPTALQKLASAAAAAAPGADHFRTADHEIEAEEAEHRTALRNMTAAFVAFILGLLIIIPFGIYILTEITASRAAIVVDNRDGTSESTDETGGAGAAGIIPDLPIPDRTVRPTQRLPITFTAALEELERDFHAADGLPEPVRVKFKILIEQTRHSWVRFDEQSLEHLRAFIVSAFYEKGTDTEAARTLVEIIDPMTSPSSSGFDPLTVQPLIWSDAMLTILGTEAGLPATARNELENHRRLRNQTQRRSSNGNRATRLTFREATRQAVETSVPRLLAEGADAAGWQRWSEALQSVNLPVEVVETIVCRALYELLIEAIDLNLSESARTNALILMTNITWNQAAEARRTILAWFSDPRITAGDLAIMTAYLATSNEIPGLDDSFILSVDANMEKRAELNAQLAAAWKPAASAVTRNEPTALDADMVDWLARAERILNTPLPDATASKNDNAEAALALLLQTARLNAAAYLFESMSVTEARGVLASTDLKLLDAQIQAELSALSAAAIGNAAAAGDTFMNEGDFAIAFAAADERNDRLGREEVLQELRHGLADDLGPADSAALIRLAFTGSPRGLRELAIDTIATRFVNGPNLLLRLADSIAPDQPNRSISLLIERITSRSLPDTKSRNWYAEARHALLERVIHLLGASAETTRLDALAGLLAQTYAIRGGVDSQSIATFVDPAVAAEVCYNAWMSRAKPMLPVNPIPATRRDIERRRETRRFFQRDPIGAFAATQVGILETAIYVTAAERPSAVSGLLNLLDDATRNRAEAATGLDQLIHLERAILRVWIIRVRLAWGIHS